MRVLLHPKSHCGDPAQIHAYDVSCSMTQYVALSALHVLLMLAEVRNTEWDGMSPKL